ncbi:UNVERIFIED_CONTAM: hypothetical protein RMT77_008407 [Armadillidium vulgare]
MAISKVNIALDAYMVCLYHSLTTECEEIMGLLIGYFPNIPDENTEDKTCNVVSAITLRRSDKRKDRVEISPEMLIEAQQQAELMSASSDKEMHIVGWYHSHPHITVWPSDIDLQTQAGYQQMDERFIGLIFSVYNEDKIKVGSHHLTCFQAENINLSGSPKYKRVLIPFSIIQTNLTPNNQHALETMLSTLYEEQKEVLDESRRNFSHLPLVHLHNSSIMVRSVCALSQLIIGPLVTTLENEIKVKEKSMKILEEEANYLEKMLKENGVNPDE